MHSVRCRLFSPSSSRLCGGWLRFQSTLSSVPASSAPLSSPPKSSPAAIVTTTTTTTTTTVAALEAGKALHAPKLFVTPIDQLISNLEPKTASHSLDVAIRALKAYYVSPKPSLVTLQLQIHLQEPNGRYSDPIRASFQLPHGLPKKQKVLVFAEGPIVEKLKAVGADIVGGPEIFPQIIDGTLKFDRVLSTTDMLKHVKNIARDLKNNTPTQKKGSVADDDALIELVSSFKTGMQLTTSKSGWVHVPVGKVFDDFKVLHENTLAVLKAFKLASPESKPIVHMSVVVPIVGKFNVKINEALSAALGYPVTQKDPPALKIKKTPEKKKQAPSKKERKEKEKNDK